MFQTSKLGQGNLTPEWTIQAGLNYISQDGIIVQKFTGTSAPYMKIKSWNATTGELICDGEDWEFLPLKVTHVSTRTKFTL
jgi:hypothetical protein